MEYILVKWLHILSSTLLMGTGIGSAFYLFVTVWQRDARLVAFVAGRVVIADWLFTTTTLVFQPLSGIYLAHLMNMPLTTPWMLWSIGLFLVTVVCWLPVVWIQIRLRDTAHAAAQAGAPLSSQFRLLFRCWVALGIPALVAMLAIFFLMVAKHVPWH
jgi:uncharacterized membrane protein